MLRKVSNFFDLLCKENCAKVGNYFITVYKKVYIKFILKMNVAYINSLTLLRKPKLVGYIPREKKITKKQIFSLIVSDAATAAGLA